MCPCVPAVSLPSFSILGGLGAKGPSDTEPKGLKITVLVLLQGFQCKKSHSLKGLERKREKKN